MAFEPGLLHLLATFVLVGVVSYAIAERIAARIWPMLLVGLMLTTLAWVVLVLADIARKDEVFGLLAASFGGALVSAALRPSVHARAPHPAWYVVPLVANAAAVWIALNYRWWTPVAVVLAAAGAGIMWSLWPLVLLLWRRIMPPPLPRGKTIEGPSQERGPDRVDPEPRPRQDLDSAGKAPPGPPSERQYPR